MAVGEVSICVEELARSRAFFYADPNVFTEFDTTRDGLAIVTCADHRDETADALKTAIQTVGGGGGVGDDASTAKTAMTGRVVTRSRALQEDRAGRSASILDVHPDCRFEAHLPAIYQEEIQPGDFTIDSIARWAKLHDAEDVVATNNGLVVDALQRKLAYVQVHGTENVLPIVDGLYPEYANVVEMEPGSNGLLYMVNHHPGLGLNRRQEHRVLGLEVQAYCESLGAQIADLERLAISNQERGLRLTALFRRAAAGRTILAGPNPRMEYAEVFRAQSDPSRFVVRQVSGPKA